MKKVKSIFYTILAAMITLTVQSDGGISLLSHKDNDTNITDIQISNDLREEEQIRKNFETTKKLMKVSLPHLILDQNVGGAKFIANDLAVVYNPNLSKYLTDKEEMCVFAHELGHFQQYSDPCWSKKLYEKYKRSWLVKYGKYTINTATILCIIPPILGSLITLPKKVFQINLCLYIGNGCLGYGLQYIGNKLSREIEYDADKRSATAILDLDKNQRPYDIEDIISLLEKLPYITYQEKRLSSFACSFYKTIDSLMSFVAQHPSQRQRINAIKNLNDNYQG